MARDHQMTLSLMEDQMRSNWEMIYQILHVVHINNQQDASSIQNFILS
jgi:hypothetical protein